MPSVTSVIMNYNAPNITDDICDILKSNGFENILSVDNGSDIEPLAKSANFILPKNIRAPGQARMVLIYLMDYFPSDYYFLINNSGKLLPEVDYKKAIETDTENIKNLLPSKKNLGILLASLLGEDIQKKYPHQFLNKNLEYRTFWFPQPICMAVSHALLSICRKNKSAMFNLDLFRGWGMDLELFYEANKNNFAHIVSSNFYGDKISVI